MKRIGAIAAMGTSAQIPELIRAVVVLDPPIFLRELSIKSNGVYTYFSSVYDIMTRRRAAREVLSEMFPGMDDSSIEYMHETLRCVDPEFVHTLLEDRYFDDLDAQRLIEKVTCPMLVLYGETEKGGVVRNRDVEFFLSHAPNVTVVQIKNAGHVLQMDQPARVLEQIAKFMKGL